MYEPISIEFNNRKPSRAVIMRTLAEYLKHGFKSFDLRWGENYIELDWHPSHEQWYGRGWFKEIGGDDIAKELNQYRKEAQKFIKDHFTFIHIK
jgi:hypothetical protein